MTWFSSSSLVEGSLSGGGGCWDMLDGVEDMRKVRGVLVYVVRSLFVLGQWLLLWFFASTEKTYSDMSVCYVWLLILVCPIECPQKLFYISSNHKS